MKAALVVAALLPAAVPAAIADSNQPPSRPDEITAGQRVFALHCTLCHGVDGRGGRGSNLARPKLRRASDDKALAELIASGIPGTEMPAVWQLSDPEVARVVAYVRSLGQLPAESLPGDPSSGRTIYASRGCAACHVVNGDGGTQGPDLSDVGLRRGPAYLRQSLLDPGATAPDGFLLVRARTRDEREVEGQRLNEDTFTIQLRGLDDRLYSFRKDELASLSKQPGRSPMPAYGAALTPSELEDLVAYLAELGRQP
jgi:putative heme-binding domain-containing protein